MKTMLKYLCCSGAFLFAALLPAQTQQPPTDAKPTSSLGILAGRLVDVRTGHVSTNVYIIVEKDRISAPLDLATEVVPVHPAAAALRREMALT